MGFFKINTSLLEGLLNFLLNKLLFKSNLDHFILASVGIFLLLAPHSADAQCIKDAILNIFNKGPNGNGAIIGQDSVVHIGRAFGIVDVNTNAFVIYKNNILDSDGSSEYDVGDKITILPAIPGVGAISTGTDESGCTTTSTTYREALLPSLPVKWKSISADVVNGEMRVDATSASAENVRDVELEVSVDGKHFFGVDREDAVNGTGEHTYTFSVSVRRLAQLLGITGPTVVYYAVKNNDNDGKSERSQIQAIEIHPDGFAQELKVFPNIASSSAQIKVLLPGDPQTEYTLHLYELTSGKLVIQNRKQGGAEVQLSSLMNHDLPAGQYFISLYGLATSAVTRFIITE